VGSYEVMTRTSEILRLSRSALRSVLYNGDSPVCSLGQLIVHIYDVLFFGDAPVGPVTCSSSVEHPGNS
jgi:hypothetical protein